MPDKYTAMTPELYDYLVDHRSERDPVLAALAEETEALGPISLMQVAPEQGAFLTLLARAIGARAAIEVGTFTGYSALCIARGLAPGGRLICCDVNEQWTAIGRRHWERAGVADRIDLRLGPATETLRQLPEGPQFDLAFIDADKPNYRNYYDSILPRLRPNGILLFDNVLWMGAVVDASNNDESTMAIRAINDFVTSDPRVEAVMLPISDGLTVVRKRGDEEGRQSSA
jgi:caffeoyl-CoA O-methyltransferase